MGENSRDLDTMKPNIGVHYDTSWTRRPAMNLLRDLVFSALIGPISRWISTPSLEGIESIASEHGPMIFAPNHTSHFDTLAFLCAIPARYRKKMVVAAAVDNFFNVRWKCIVYSLFLGTIPVERTRINRKSADIAAELLLEGYNLLIFPEGGRSYTDQMMDFHGGAAYLAKRCDAPVVPVYLEGVRSILPKGATRIHRSPVVVHIGHPMRPLSATEGRKEEDARRFTQRIQAAVADLGAQLPPDPSIASG